MHSDPVGKALLVGDDGSSWFAGTWTRLVEGVGLRVERLSLTIKTGGLGVLAGVAVDLAMHGPVVVLALLLIFGLAPLLEAP